MSDIRVIATGLRFPEGPVAMKDGSIVLVEIERQTVTRVYQTVGRTSSRIPAADRTGLAWGRTARFTSATMAVSSGGPR